MRFKHKKRKNKAGKAEEVQKWFKRSVTYEGEPYVVDLEQAEAIADTSKNAIVVARAGSGKTRTIVAKIVYLIAKEGVKPEEIMAFVFNSNAAKEINLRLSKMRVDGVPIVPEVPVGRGKKTGVAVASTFHAFSRKIVYDVCGGEEKCGKILAEDKSRFMTARVVQIMMGEKKWHDKILQFIKNGTPEPDEEEIAEDINGVSGINWTGRGRKKPELKFTEMQKFGHMMTTFVNRAQQKYLANEEMEKWGMLKRKKGEPRDLKEAVQKKLRENDLDFDHRLFLELGLECYRRYHWYLLHGNDKQKGVFRKYGTDFNLLVAWAGRAIAKKTPEVRALLENKKYILIDEYQDFSQLFLSIIMAIREVQPEVKLFVVGDDWQAINRFAGSDVDYFQDFERYFPEEARRFPISTNYRCDQEIVRKAKTFMRRAMKEPGDFRANSKNLGRVIAVDSSVHTLAEVIYKERKASEIMVLHRNNVPLTRASRRIFRELRMLMREMGETYDKEILKKTKFYTMHRSKGLESEVVIILDADEGVIPRMHSGTRLYSVFGENEENALDDQKRLFYVALTRGKKRVYIMHDFRNKRALGFLRFLGWDLDKWDS